MKEVLLQFAEYNMWANQRLTEAIATLPVDLQNQEVKSSYKSVRLTLQHMMQAEDIWWQRVKLVEAALPLGDTGQTTGEIIKSLINSSTQWKEWIEKSTTTALEHVFSYRNSKKEEFKQPVFQMLLHLFNHQTYHRGQLVTILRLLGVEKIPATDFIVWSRKKKNT